MAVADVNGDGKPDLVVANRSSNTVSVLLGNGDGTFAAQQTFTTSVRDPYSVAVADINGDGKPDIVVANASSNTVSVLLGNGDGTFGAQQTFAVGGSPFTVAVADLNRDGRLDLVTANFTSANVSVLLAQTYRLLLSPIALPLATASQTYTQTITASGGEGTPLFTLSAGSLPSGLTLSPSGVLSGTPTAAGSFTFTITATDAGCGLTGTQIYTINVRPAVTANTANLAQNASTITITGTGFSTIAAQNLVSFSSGAGVVTASTSTQLTVHFSTAPALGSLTAVVTIIGVTSSNPVQVATEVAAPTVTLNTANLAQNAPTLIITGTGFSTTAAQNTVSFSSGTGTVTVATATQLTVTFGTAPALGGLTVVVTSNGGSSGAAKQVANIVTAPSVTVNATDLAQNAPAIIITGTGFSTTAAQNTVSFNLGAAGTVIAATATQLTVSFATAPTGLGSLTVVVTSNSGSSGAAKQVANVVGPPSVTTNTANLAQNAPILIITGTGFSTTAAQNTVSFNLGAAGTVIAATATQLTVSFSTAPTSLGSLTVVVTSNSGSSSAAVQVANVVAALPSQ